MVRTIKDDMFLSITAEVAKLKWVMDSTTTTHIFEDQTMFDTLSINGTFGNLMLR